MGRGPRKIGRGGVHFNHLKTRQVRPHKLKYFISRLGIFLDIEETKNYNKSEEQREKYLLIFTSIYP